MCVCVCVCMCWFVCVCVCVCVCVLASIRWAGSVCLQDGIKPFAPLTARRNIINACINRPAKKFIKKSIKNKCVFT